MTDADRLAINRLIGEAIGTEQRLYWVKNGKRLRPCESDECDGRHLRDGQELLWPDFCGNDAVALEAIKGLRKRGFDIAINISTTGIVGVKICKPVWGESVSEGYSKQNKERSCPIAAALKGAMVEEYKELASKSVCPKCCGSGGTEEYPCTVCMGGDKKGPWYYEDYRLKPALQAALQK